MYFIDQCHQHDIGVILDWVPAHFPKDGAGLNYFDGTHLYAHQDPRQGEHQDWGTMIFNYGRNEVRSFIISNGLFWLDKYHIDGLRVDAVASMLYLDYSREEDQWIPNRYGGRENLEAISFLQKMNEVVHGVFPGVLTIAEESTSWPLVSLPTYLGGLGFSLKWNMGWMHDTLNYMSKDPLFRRYHHNEMTFGLMYAFQENFVLPISHDEVVHGKGSMIGKMSGDEWQKFASLRAYYGFMWAYPGKKLLFMGSEFGQWQEWNFDGQLEWKALEAPNHQGLLRLIRDLNLVYRSEPALHENDFDRQGFRWIDANDSDNSVYSFLRFAMDEDNVIVVVCNFTPMVRHGYRIGVPKAGTYREMINTDLDIYRGSGVNNGRMIRSRQEESHGMPDSLVLTLPPLSTLILKPDIPIE
jgi:1,4-alpha-glucan branching enzyme